MKKTALRAMMILGLVCVAAVCEARAQDAAISAEKAALIKELMSQMGTSEDLQKMMDKILDLQNETFKASIEKTMGDDKIFTASEKIGLKSMASGAYDRMETRMREFFKTELKFDALIDDLGTRVYGKYFSEAELRDLIAFYKSPTGKKMIELAPELTMETMKVVFEQIVPKLNDFVKRVTDEELALLKQKAAAPKKRT